MNVKETQVSLRNQFYALLRRHCPDLVFGSNPFGHRWEDKRFYFWFYKKPGFYQKFLSGTGRRDEIRRSLCKLRVGPTEPFEEGEWEDLEFEIYDDVYFEKLKLVANDYEKLSGKEVKIKKSF